MELLPAILVLTALLVVTIGIGLTLRWRQNRPRPFDPREIVEPTRLGAERLGETATLLQFSTEMCSRCPGVHRTLREIADDRDGVLHLNVDLTHRVDIAQHFRVLQTPTTLILDKDGMVRSRFGGVPGRQVVEMELDRVTAEPIVAEVRGIDPRGPRFAASVTAVLLLVATLLALVGISTQGSASFGWFAYQPVGDFAFVAGRAWAIEMAPVGARVADPGFLAVLVIALLFLWGVVSPRTAPWGVLYRRAIQPRLAPPTDLEDPRPPRFAQGVGLFVTTVGLALHVLGVPLALPIAAALAFMAAFLNAAFGLCLGCQLWLLLQRVGLVGRTA